MKRKLKLLVAIASLVLVITVLPFNVYANEITPQTETKELAIQPRGNITGYIFKIYNGRQWKRLWSYTYNKWIDKDWSLA